MSAVDDPKTLGSGRLTFADEKDVDEFVEMLGKFESGAATPDEWRAYRLVRGIYGQRQDDEMMIRVKVPLGILSPAQLTALADVADKWSNGKGHITTRQNIQFHFVKLPDVEEAMRRLGDVGLTTREACGNSVRNITGCPHAGTAASELFDATPYGEVMTQHLLRGQWSSSLPRKFKIAFGGCCGRDDVEAAINDLGFLQRVDAQGRPGFRVTIGGGTATLRRSGFLAHEFLPAEEILEVGEAVVRVFHRVGNRKDKHKARLKFAIDKLKVAGFLAEYEKERAAIRAEGGRPYTLPAALPPPKRFADPTGPTPPLPPGFQAWAKDSVRAQKQPGFSAVTIRIILGDVYTAQFRALARLVTQYGDGELRTTHDQNLVIRYVPDWQVPALYAELGTIGLARTGASTVADVTACPGSASCKLAVTASRGLGDLVGDALDAKPEVAALARDMDIKISGCPNGCGQHHISGIGFQGGVRKVGGKAVPQYHMTIGGSIEPDGARFGRLVGKVPARRIPDAVERVLRLYAAEKTPTEDAPAFFRRVDIDRVTALLKDLIDMNETTAKPDDFIDLGETKTFEVVLSEGECAA